jgi:hypothetical protein
MKYCSLYILLVTRNREMDRGKKGIPADIVSN